MLFWIIVGVLAVILAVLLLLRRRHPRGTGGNPADIKTRARSTRIANHGKSSGYLGGGGV